jgi:CBS-domain-containing membrane protein
MSDPNLTAAHLMHSPRSVAADLSVEDLARVLLRDSLDGVCVVDDAGRLRGVVTTMDLVFQEQPVHLPSFIVFLDALIPLGGERAEQEVRKIAGASVAEIMTTEVVTVRPETPIGELAERMVRDHLSLLPVLDDAGDLVGVVDKRAILEAAFKTPRD